MNMIRSYTPVIALLLTSIAYSTPLAAQTREKSCTTYAHNATSQHQMNTSIKCNYKGSRWSSDFDGQKKWCMGVRPKITQAETAARKKLLHACYQKKVSGHNKRHPALVPEPCRLNRENYEPVSYFLTRQNYNLDPKPTAPISGGLIKKDYNRDGKLDYIFMERSPQHKFRSILCMSHASGWKRTKLHDLREDIYPHYGVALQHIGLTTNGFYYSQGSSEHNLGSRNSKWNYSYSQQHKGFLLDSHESSFYSGDGMMENTSDFTDYIKGERRETVDCNSVSTIFREGCTPKNNHVTRMKKSEYTIAKRRLK